VGGFVEVLAGHLACIAFSEKCGGTPNFCGRLSSFTPMTFPEVTMSFLGTMFHLLSRPSPFLFGEIKKERGAAGRKETLSPRRPCCQRAGSLLCVAPVVRRV